MASDVTDVDRNNPDVVRLFEHMKPRIEKFEEENRQLQDKYRQADEKTLQLQKENEQLRARLEQMSATPAEPVDGRFRSKGRRRQQQFVPKSSFQSPSCCQNSVFLDSRRCHGSSGMPMRRR